MNIRKIMKSAIIIISILVLALLLSLLWINKSTKKNIYSNIIELPYNKVGLIPGCNKYISTGVINVFYTERINAGVELYNAGKIDFILVSGDNAHASYDEPREMKKSLIEAGIPKERIFSDYAGFRTLDTIIRAKEVFKLSKVTFISQNFQNQRGIFIGNKKNINIVAYNANNTRKKIPLKIGAREILAKVKMLIDLYILDKGPKFLGEEIVIREV